MFSKSSKKIRESTYGLLASSVIPHDSGETAVNASNGTAFMVVPGYLVTAAHGVHRESNPQSSIHKHFELIRTVDVGQQMETAVFVSEDVAHDIALLKIEKPRNSSAIKFEKSIVPRGTSCGFLGFPLANVQFFPDGKCQFNLFERFQGAYISNYMPFDKGLPDERNVYEVDHVMYPGSSGCPAFNMDGAVVGMQVASVMQKGKEEGHDERVAISLVVPSIEIINFLKSQNIKI